MSIFGTTTGSTGNTNASANSSSSSTGTSTSNPTFSPQLQDMMNQLLAYSSNSMSNPAQMFAPIQNAGLQSINSSFAAVPGQVSAQMASRGYGSSGAAGDAMYQANLSRANAVSGFQGTLANDEINQMNAGASLGENLLNTGKGTSTTSSSDSTNSGTSTGFYMGGTSSDDMGSVLGSLASLLMISNPNLLKIPTIGSTSGGWNVPTIGGSTGGSTGGPGPWSQGPDSGGDF
jgi:hypothetical protein